MHFTFLSNVCFKSHSFIKIMWAVPLSSVTNVNNKSSNKEVAYELVNRDLFRYKKEHLAVSNKPLSYC